MEQRERKQIVEDSGFQKPERKEQTFVSCFALNRKVLSHFCSFQIVFISFHLWISGTSMLQRRLLVEHGTVEDEINLNLFL